MEADTEDAGYSKGAVYSNFATKAELCLAVLDRVHTEQAAAPLTEVGTAPDRVAGLTRWAEKNIGDSSRTALEVEFATTCRRDEFAREEPARRRRSITEPLATVLDAQAETVGVTLSMPAAVTATTLLSLGIGIGVQRAIDPTVTVQPLVDLLRQVLSPAAHP